MNNRINSASFLLIHKRGTFKQHRLRQRLRFSLRVRWSLQHQQQIDEMNLGRFQQGLLN